VGPNPKRRRRRRLAARQGGDRGASLDDPPPRSNPRLGVGGRLSDLTRHPLRKGAGSNQCLSVSGVDQLGPRQFQANRSKVGHRGRAAEPAKASLQGSVADARYAGQIPEVDRLARMLLDELLGTSMNCSAPGAKCRTWCRTSRQPWRPPFHRHDGTAAESPSVRIFCPMTVIDMSMLSTLARTLGTRSHRSVSLRYVTSSSAAPSM